MEKSPNAALNETLSSNSPLSPQMFLQSIVIGRKTTTIDTTGAFTYPTTRPLPTIITSVKLYLSNSPLWKARIEKRAETSMHR